MFSSVQTTRLRACHDAHMLLVLSLGVALLAIVLTSRVFERGRANATRLGWMSEKWLTQHRASHSA